jgi:hypothetical protein
MAMSGAELLGYVLAASTLEGHETAVDMLKSLRKI